VSATAATVLDVHRNGSPIGTITFAIGASMGTFATAGGGAETFAAGDRLAIINEDPADAMLADLSITFWARGPDHGLGFRSDTAATQLSSITTEQFFDQVPTLNPRETAHVQVSVDFPSSPTDHAIAAMYTTLDDTSEVWALIPMMEFLIENTTDTNRISFLVTSDYKFRVGVRRSGATDMITSADLSLRKDGVNA
jgi:hypothetical protein